MTLTKQSTASAIVAASAASATAPSVPSQTPPYAGTWRSACSVSHSEAKPFSRWHPGDRERADEKRAAAPRHPPQQPAEAVELERSGRPLEHAGAEEQTAP